MPVLNVLLLASSTIIVTVTLNERFERFWFFTWEINQNAGYR